MEDPKSIQLAHDIERMEQTIEQLCKILVPDYDATKPDRVRERSAMSVPTPSNPKPFLSILSRGRLISPAEQENIHLKANALKEELRSKGLSEVKLLLDEAKAKQFREWKCSIDEAAKLIAGRIYPDDGCSWTPGC